MDRPSTTARIPEGISVEAVRNQVDKILNSTTFVNAGRMSRFLRFSLEETLAGRTSDLKEFTLGISVFDRPVNFDPRTDPIVRVEARRLRDKLTSYYRNEGANDPLIVELPKGGYAIRVVCRQQPVELVPALNPVRSAEPLPGQNIRLAVLPFVNLAASGGGEGDYFSEGLSEELIHVLTRIPGLEVIAWGTSARLASEGEELDKLQLNYYLRGAVRSVAGQVRVSVQLIEAQGRRYIWSEVYERALGDLLAIETDIAREIASRLRVGLTASQQPHGHVLPSDRQSTGRARPAHGSEEHTLYLMGRYHTNRRTVESIQKGIQCYERAVAIRPDFALAHAGLADSYSLVTIYGAMSPAEAIPRARASALRALQLDPDEAGSAANTSLALISGMHDWDWPRGEELYRRALAQDPNYAVAHYWFASDHLAALGRFDEALHHMAIARRLDPLAIARRADPVSPVINHGPAFIAMLQRDYDEALRQYQAIVDFDPLIYMVHTSMGRVYAQMGRYAEALESYRKGAQLTGAPNSKVSGAMGQALALLGREEEARVILNELVKRSKTSFVPATAIAIVHLGLGELDQSLDYLEAAVSCHEFSVALAYVHPVYDPVRETPRFQALLHKMRFLP